MPHSDTRLLPTTPPNAVGRFRNEVEDHIQKRENSLLQLRTELQEAQRAGAWKSSDASSTDSRRQRVRRHLLSLVRQSASVVEGITLWRTTLWRPYPFLHKSQDYLRKVCVCVSVCVFVCSLGARSRRVVLACHCAVDSLGVTQTQMASDADFLFSADGARVMSSLGVSTEVCVCVCTLAMAASTTLSVCHTFVGCTLLQETMMASFPVALVGNTSAKKLPPEVCGAW